jgi:hypothetical protein
MGVIRTTHIEQLADFTEGRDKLGELVRRLIWAWLPNRVLGMHFLSGETNNYPGWDGWVRLTLSNGIPHYSLWELSVRRDAVEKIRSDFNKAAVRPLPPGWTRASSTYVALTARSLANKEHLEEELRSSPRNNWADVQIVDAKSLEQWIEKSPAVEQWASEMFSVTGMLARTSLTRYWATWSEVTKPPIAPRLMTTGRDTSDLVQALRFENDRTVSVQADSPEEVVGVVYALIDALPENERDKLLFNATVLGSEEIAERLAEQSLREDEDPLTILVPPATGQAQRLARKGHKVVLALGRNTPSVSQITLRRSLRSEFETALTEHMAVPQSEASSDAKACGASVSIWRVWHLLRDGSAGRVPAWARDAARKTVVPAVFARAWDESIDLDQDILSMLAARPYGWYRDDIHEFAACDDPLHERAGSVHKVIAPSVAYALVRDAVTSSQINDLVQAMKKVFSTIDKDVSDVWDSLEVDVPQENRPTYSNWLKDGLAETLLAIAFLPQPRTGILHSYGGGEGLANSLVRALPGLAEDPRLLASLRDQLPVLAEAAPIPFVEALERLLQGGANLAPLFRDRGFFGAAHHAGLLWALEVLAWSPKLLPRVTGILLELSARADTGRSGNTPLGSLREIYLAWIRGTSVPGEQRAAVLRSFADSHPNALWRLLISVLPTDHDTSSGTHEPAWRDFGRSELTPLTTREVSRTFRVYAELALGLAENSLERQLDLLDFYARFPDEYRARLLTMLEGGGGPGENTKAWERLRQFISKNRSFSTASWAVDAQSLDRMQAIATRLAPQSASARWRWLFDDAWPDLGERARDYEKRDELLLKLRGEGVEAVLSTEGADKLDALVREVKFPQTLGISVARLPRSAVWVAERLNSWAVGGSRSELAALQAASGTRYRADGDAWTSVLMETVRNSSWAPAAIAHAFLDYPPTGATFKVVDDAAREVSQVYWKNCWLHADSMDDTARSVAPEKLIEHGRAMHALELVNHRYDQFGTGVVLTVARAAVNELLVSERRTGHMDGYYLEEALKWLRSQPDVQAIDIARMEYPLIPLLTRTGTDREETLVLHDLLSEDPSFFVQVLSDAFKRRKDADSGADLHVDASVRARAKAAWSLLRSWKKIPGLGTNGEIDRAALRIWIDAALEAAKSADRLEVALIKIGELLYHAKPDPRTGDWPPIAILDTVEDLASADLERGFCLEVVNSRGVTTRSPLSGGALERELQQEWEQRASALPSRWRRSKAMFNRIAEDWKRQAAWHDEDSEHMRMKWS